MTRIVFLEPAEEEMLRAATYYDNQATGLGRDFLAQVQHAVDEIAENPRSGTIMRGDIRRGLVPRFSLLHFIPHRSHRDRRHCCYASPLGAQDIGWIERSGNNNYRNHCHEKEVE